MGFGSRKRNGGGPAPPARPGIEPATEPAIEEPKVPISEGPVDGGGAIEAVACAEAVALLEEVRPWCLQDERKHHGRTSSSKATASHMPPPQSAPPPSTGPSLMGTFGSSMAGSVAGSMLGNAMSSGFGGGRSEAAPEATPVVSSQGNAQMCTFESRQFLECMTNTGENLDQCRGFYDAFKMCQSQAR
eukprot:CAMPEP_0205890400 /NCGR_PEP_ID=MMETSP1083-20121108/21507_1 /ASSEMBLY_ACC=CAM_ASM_000430 /TAXON_ID=97485 /ORGANISM="Prymnesium parvum, Strain Texoma1" /LENGTH=187 /DNA_ID=CAMNT_0053254617 /DNA_START=368 /DNA_END=933 /DNA_ORIENTATION=-